MRSSRHLTQQIPHYQVAWRALFDYMLNASAHVGSLLIRRVMCLFIVLALQSTHSCPKFRANRRSAETCLPHTTTFVNCRDDKDIIC